MNKIVFENGFVHEFTSQEMRLLRFAVRRLFPSGQTCFRVDELEELDEAAENLRSVFREGAVEPVDD